MNRPIPFILLLFSIQVIMSQTCDFEKGINMIRNSDNRGLFNEALSSIEELKKCEQFSIEHQIDLRIWEYKMFRNLLKSKMAKNALLNAKEIIEENEIPMDMDYFFHLAECFALNKDAENYHKALDEIEKHSGIKILELVKQDSLLLGMHFYSKYMIIDRDRFPVKAEGYLYNSLSAFENSNNTPLYYVTNTLRALGNLNRSNGDFDKSQQMYQRELALYESNYDSDHFNIAVAHYNIGGVLYEKLDYQKALEHYLKTHEIWVHHYENSNRYMRYLNEAIGDLYWELNDRQNALTYFNYSIDGEDPINNDISEQVIDTGDSLSNIGNYNIAIEYYEKALKWREETYGKNHILTGACKNFVARAIHSSGDIKGSLDAYQEAIIILVDGFDDNSWYSNPSLKMNIQSYHYLLESLIAKGRLLNDLYQLSNDVKDLKASLDTFETAVLVLEEMKNFKMSDSSKVFWTNRTLSLIESIIETSLNLHEQTNNKEYLKKAFIFSERSKALLLLSTLSNLEVSSIANVDEKILLKEMDIKKRINDYRGRINNEEKRCSEVRGKMLSLWKDELSSLQNEYALLINDIEVNYPEYYQLKYQLPSVTLNNVQEDLLDNDSKLISYFAGEKRIYVFKITQDELSVRSIDNTNAVYQQSTDFYYSIIDIENIRNNPQLVFEDYVRNAHSLYTKLLGPELEYANPSGSLIIIPDGILSYIPFEILLVKSPNSTIRDYKALEYLNNSYAISYNPSATIGILNKTNNSSYTEYQGFAPDYSEQLYTDSNTSLSDLKFNNKEVTDATELFDGKIWVGMNVNENVFKTNSSNAGIIHLAMHGEVDDEHPLLSKLYFNSSDLDDGILHTYEIYNLSIPAQLVILSACNTATGKLVRGEGILSLERAFQYAGSNSLVSTLWSVDDQSSATINQLFLENLKIGMSKDIALQKAKNDFISSASPNKLHPYYWSGFRLTGNTTPLVSKSFFNMFLILGGVGLLAVFFFLFKRKK